MKWSEPTNARPPPVEGKKQCTHTGRWAVISAINTHRCAFCTLHLPLLEFDYALSRLLLCFHACPGRWHDSHGCSAPGRAMPPNVHAVQRCIVSANDNL